jgi:dTDP-4-dehydrorhamnose 3,5-epimerase
MHCVETDLEGVLLLEPRVFRDDRGFFFESWNQATFDEAVGENVTFVQDNHSKSAQGVVRGVHYQHPEPQAKLVRVIAGAVWDVAVDLRRSSRTFRQWVGVELSAENNRQLWIPEGFGHGFLTLTEGAEVLYKATAFYRGEHDRAIAWNDPQLGIDWPMDVPPVLSAKDEAAPGLEEAVLFE